MFRSWKTWESGAPELAIEIADGEIRSDDWSEKLSRYHELGVRELIRYDADAPISARVRAWDRVDEDLIERVVEADTTPCVTLGLHFVVGVHPELECALRLARSSSGEDLLPTSEEAAERRIAELEAQLRGR